MHHWKQLNSMTYFKHTWSRMKMINFWSNYQIYIVTQPTISGKYIMIMPSIFLAKCTMMIFKLIKIDAKGILDMETFMMLDETDFNRLKLNTGQRKKKSKTTTRKSSPENKFIISWSGNIWRIYMQSVWGSSITITGKGNICTQLCIIRL